MNPKQLAFSNPLNEAGVGINPVLHRFTIADTMDANAMMPEISASEKQRLGLRAGAILRLLQQACSISHATTNIAALLVPPQAS